MGDRGESTGQERGEEAKSRPPGAILDFRDLQVWQKSMTMVGVVYRLVRHLPPTERFGLAAQMRRAAVSVPSNIAEGHTRRSTREFLKHISIAAGSLAELETQLLLTVQLGHIVPRDIGGAREGIHEVQRMLRGLERSLRQRLSAPGPAVP